MRLQPLPAFADNYIWTLEDADDPASPGAVIVDPGQAAPVLAAAAQGLRPALLLLTHHHPDHVGGGADRPGLAEQAELFGRQVGGDFLHHSQARQSRRGQD